MSDWAVGGGGPLEADARVTASSTMITVADGGSDHALGSWVQLIAATAYESEGVLVHMAGGSTVGGVLLDIGVGAASSENVIIPNLPWNAKAVAGHGHKVYIPIKIPQGVRVSARIRQNGAQPFTIGVGVTLVAKGLDGNRGFGAADSMGAQTGSTQGTDIDPGGTANTKGSWTELVASTSNSYKYLIVGINPSQNTALATIHFLVDIGVGAASSEVVVVPDINWAMDASEISAQRLFGIPISIASGERVSARAQASSIDASDRIIDICLVGLY